MYLGLDFGTTFSQASAFVDDRLEVLLRTNYYGGVPSAFYYSEEDGVLVGQEALDISEGIKSSGLVRTIKMQLYNRILEVEVNGKKWATQSIIEEICKGVLEEAIITAEENLFDPQIEGVVIAVPVKFGSYERNVIFHAVNSALKRIYDNLETPPFVIDILKEPVAAGIYYFKKTKGEKKQVLVYDLGGGTCDVSIIKSNDDRIDQFEVVDDDMLPVGGECWDNVFSEYVKKELEKQGVKADGGDLEKIRRSVVKAKHDFSKPSRTQANLRLEKNGTVYSVVVTRETFDEITKGLLDQTIEMTRKLYDRVKKNHRIDNITDIICVGGSSNMLQVKSALEKAFPGCNVLRFTPEYAVGNGLGLYADMLSQMPIPEPEFEPESESESSVRTGDLDDIEDENNTQSREEIRQIVIDQVEFSYGTIIKNVVNGKEFDNLYNMILKGSTYPAKSVESFRQVFEKDDYVDFEIYESENTAQIAPLGKGERMVGVLKLPRFGKRNLKEKLTMELRLTRSGMIDAVVRDQRGTKIDAQFVFDGQKWSEKR